MRPESNCTRQTLKLHSQKSNDRILCQYSVLKFIFGFRKFGVESKNIINIITMATLLTLLSFTPYVRYIWEGSYVQGNIHIIQLALPIYSKNNYMIILTNDFIVITVAYSSLTLKYQDSKEIWRNSHSVVPALTTSLGH